MGHLGYEKGDPAGRGSGNSRNGVSTKTVLTEHVKCRSRLASVGLKVFGTSRDRGRRVRSRMLGSRRWSSAPLRRSRPTPPTGVRVAWLGPVG